MTNLEHALDDYNKAQGYLHTCMTHMDYKELEAALNAAGYHGKEMLPLRAEFKLYNADTDTYVYECEWSDDGLYNDNDDTGRVDGKLFVKLVGNEIHADW